MRNTHSHPSNEIRCPSCQKLLGKVLADGAVETRLGNRYRIVVREGLLTCAHCNEDVPVEQKKPDVKLTFGRP